VSPSAAFGWCGLAVFFMLTALDLSRQARPGAEHDLVNAQGCAALAFSLTTYAVVRVHAPSRPTAEALGVRPTHPLFYPLACALGVLTLVSVSWVSAWVETRWPLGADELAAMRDLVPPPGFGHRAAFAALAVAVGPLTEEMLFRGALFRLLAKGGRGAASVVLLTALLFTLSHVTLRAVVHVLPSGLVLGALRSRSGSLVPPLLAHAAFNGVTTFELLRGAVRFDGPEPPPPLWQGLGATALVAAGLALAHALGGRSEAARAARAGDAP
jgi:hypothetical protein